MPKENKCDLCNLTQRTEWFYEDEDWVICRCKTCHRIMIVFRKHTMFIPIEKLSNALTVARHFFGKNIMIRMNQRQIKKHFHVHIYNTGVGK